MQGKERVKKFESVMLSAAKHLCSLSQVLEPKATAEILRFAQDDSWLIFSHLRSAGKNLLLVAWLRGGVGRGEGRPGRTKCLYVLSIQFLRLSHSTFQLCHSLPISRHPAYMNCSRQDWNGLIQHR